MSQSFTLIARESNLSARYFPLVELNPEEEYGLALIGFYTFNSVLNVDETNNRFVYKHVLTAELYTIEIAPGNYEIDTLGYYIQQRVIGQEVTNNKKEREASDVNDIFCLKANNSTLRCEIKCLHDIDFSVPHTPARMLGFSPKIYERNVVHQRDPAKKCYLTNNSLPFCSANFDMRQASYQL